MMIEPLDAADWMNLLVIGRHSLALVASPHLICFHLHEQHQVITVIITALCRLSPPSYLPINLCTNDAAPLNRGIMGMKLSLMCSAPGGRSAAWLK